MPTFRFIDSLIPPIAFLFGGLVFASAAGVLLFLATLDLHVSRGRMPVAATMISPARVDPVGRTNFAVVLDYTYNTPHGTWQGSQYKQGFAFFSRAAAQAHADRLNAGGQTITIWVDRIDHSRPIAFTGVTAEDSTAALFGVPAGFAGLALLQVAATSLGSRLGSPKFACVRIDRRLETLVLTPRRTPFLLLCFVASLLPSLAATTYFYTGSESGTPAHFNAPRFTAAAIATLSVLAGLYLRACWFFPPVSASVCVGSFIVRRRTPLGATREICVASSHVRAAIHQSAWHPYGRIELVTDQGTRYALASDEPEVMERTVERINAAILGLQATSHP